ncbi:MAG: cytochrome c [Boseongicola sp.]
MRSSAIFAGVAAVAILGVGTTYFLRTPDMSSSTGAEQAQAEFVMPELSAEATEGARYFNAVCAACHGQNGLGTEKGPPLITDIYNPGHHADESFQIAARSGVRQHHWPYGNMPAQNVTRAEVAKIVAYIRELQTANGIVYRPHNM